MNESNSSLLSSDLEISGMEKFDYKRILSELATSRYKIQEIATAINPNILKTGKHIRNVFVTFKVPPVHKEITRDKNNRILNNKSQNIGKPTLSSKAKEKENNKVPPNKLQQTSKVALIRTPNQEKQTNKTENKKSKSSHSNHNKTTLNDFFQANTPSKNNRIIKPTFLPLHLYQNDKITPKRSSIRPPELYFQSNPRPPPPQPVRPPKPPPKPRMQDEGIQTAPQKRDIMLQAQTEPDYETVVDIPHLITKGTSMEYHIGDMHKEAEVKTQPINSNAPEIPEGKLLDWLTTNFTNLLNNTIKQKEESKIEDSSKPTNEELFNNLRQELLTTVKSILLEKEEQTKLQLEALAASQRKLESKKEEKDDFIDEDELNELLEDDEEEKTQKKSTKKKELDPPKRETRDSSTQNEPPRAIDSSVQVNPPPVNMGVQVDQRVDTSVQVDNRNELLEVENNKLKELIESFLKREQEKTAATIIPQPEPSKEEIHDSFDEMAHFLDEEPDERLKTSNITPPIKQTAEIAIQVDEPKAVVSVIPKTKEEESSVLEEDDSYETSSVSSEGEKPPNKMGLFSEGEVYILPNVQTRTREAYRMDYLQKRLKVQLGLKDPWKSNKKEKERETDSEESLDYQRMKMDEKRSDVSEGEVVFPRSHWSRSVK